jgi:hypothetical protein
MSFGKLGAMGRGMGHLGSLGGLRASDVTFTNKLAVRDYNTSAAGVATFDTWLGRTADYVTVFVSHSNWTAFDSSISALVSAYAGDTRPKVWTVGLNVDGTTLDDAAAGTFNSHYLSAAQAILADAPASGFIFIRPGHEFNLASGYPWEAVTSGKAPKYAAAFRQFVATFRSVSSRFRFIWNPNWITIDSLGAGSGADITPAYPGDAYVDVIGTDFYYNSSKDDASPDVAFNFVRDLANSGLAWQVAFARAHRKAFCVCEFGTNWDRQKWIDLVYSWVTSNGYAYAGYWDNSVLDFAGRLSDDSKLYSGDRFIQDFKNGGPIPIFEHTFFWDAESFSGQGASASFSVVSGVYPSYAQVTGVSNFADKAQRTWSVTNGANYRVELDIDTNSLNAKVQVIQASSPFNVLGTLTTNTTGLTHKTLTFTANQSSVFLQIIPFAGNAAQVVKFNKVELFAA